MSLDNNVRQITTRKGRTRDRGELGVLVVLGILIQEILQITSVNRDGETEEKLRGHCVTLLNLHPGRK